MSIPGEPRVPELTGRTVVVLGDDVRADPSAVDAALRALTTSELATLVRTSDFDDRILDVERAASADAIVFDELGIAVLARDPSELASALALQGEGGGIVAVEPERILYAIPYEEPQTADFADDDAFTWGLRATGVDTTTATGEGIRIAVLDTGIDLTHPDFADREVTTRSFTGSPTAADGHGHGTHCAGTAAGAASPAEGRRYGVAPGAILFAGKVLSDAGSGADAWILAGIEWALTNGCHIISMSLGADLRTVSATYEAVGQRAFAAGTLIVAAAGNNASRSSGDTGFVGVPANSPSIMAVAALDSQMQIADFSAASNPVAGGQIDIAGPGVDVYSSWRMPRRTNTISGTSMATPHVAGMAALHSQATGATAQALWTAIVEAAQPVELPATDAGAGLVRAPTAAAEPSEPEPEPSEPVEPEPRPEPVEPEPKPVEPEPEPEPEPQPEPQPEPKPPAP